MEMALELRLAGFPDETIEQMSLPDISWNLRKIDTIESRNLVELGWLWMCAAQGRDKDMKKQLAGRIKRAKDQNTKVWTAAEIKARI